MILGSREGKEEKEGKVEGQRGELLRIEEGAGGRFDEQDRRECAGCGHKIHDKFLLKVGDK